MGAGAARCRPVLPWGSLPSGREGRRVTFKRFFAGDFVETGTAAGGMTILMSRVLERYEPRSERMVWGADSFAVSRWSSRLAQGRAWGVRGGEG